MGVDDLTPDRAFVLGEVGGHLFGTFFDGARRPDATEHVLFLGDSFTWGWGVSQGEVFTDLLQRRFAPFWAGLILGVIEPGDPVLGLTVVGDLDQDNISDVIFLK